MIAVVDDDAPVRVALVRLLRSAGYTCRSFASGQELLESWAHERPHCLVLDLQMPGLSGLEVQRKLRSLGSDIPVIVTTASDEQRVYDECKAEHASACLRKPIEDEVLLAAIERATRSG